MRRSRTFAVTLLIPSALAVAACGGVSKEDYAQDLDGICSDIEEQTEKIQEGGEADNPAELTGQLDDLRAAITDGIERMRDLERPDGDDGEKGEQYVNELETTLNEEVVPALDDLEAAVKAKDQVKARAAATRLQAIDSDQSNQLAEELGAEECAEE
jgi:hypothetical protein